MVLTTDERLFLIVEHNFSLSLSLSLSLTLSLPLPLFPRYCCVAPSRHRHKKKAETRIDHLRLIAREQKSLFFGKAKKKNSWQSIKEAGNKSKRHIDIYMGNCHNKNSCLAMEPAIKRSLTNWCRSRGEFTFHGYIFFGYFSSLLTKFISLTFSLSLSHLLLYTSFFLFLSLSLSLSLSYCFISLYHHHHHHHYYPSTSLGGSGRQTHLSLSLSPSLSLSFIALYLFLSLSLSLFNCPSLSLFFLSLYLYLRSFPFYLSKWFSFPLFYNPSISFTHSFFSPVIFFFSLSLPISPLSLSL
ncbi:unnamed protein product [Acanthosepion pharaonis]|uniref:Uncharacterized protein n=1 Tax=Acanthosepion pharaonis TaxID=158019 RepID=A0A812DWS6_ACAPH|nr:unnamed protein product [Sepia pharaonis]